MKKIGKTYLLNEDVWRNYKQVYVGHKKALDFFPSLRSLALEKTSYYITTHKQPMEIRTWWVNWNLLRKKNYIRDPILNGMPHSSIQCWPTFSQRPHETLSQNPPRPPPQDSPSETTLTNVCSFKLQILGKVLHNK